MTNISYDDNFLKLFYLYKFIQPNHRLHPATSLPRHTTTQSHFYTIGIQKVMNHHISNHFPKKLKYFPTHKLYTDQSNNPELSFKPRPTMFTTQNPPAAPFLPGDRPSADKLYRSVHRACAAEGHWPHMDFRLGINAAPLVDDDIIARLTEESNGPGLCCYCPNWHNHTWDGNNRGFYHRSYPCILTTGSSEDNVQTDSGLNPNPPLTTQPLRVTRNPSPQTEADLQDTTTATKARVQIKFDLCPTCALRADLMTAAAGYLTHGTSWNNMVANMAEMLFDDPMWEMTKEQRERKEADPWYDPDYDDTPFYSDDD